MKISCRNLGLKTTLLAVCCAVALPVFVPLKASAEDVKIRGKDRRDRVQQEEAREAARQRRSSRPVAASQFTDTPNYRAYVRQDAYGTPRRPGTRQLVTGSLIPQDVNVYGNNADTASPVKVYGQGDLRTRGGGLSTADSLRRLDPSIQIGGH